MNSIQHLADSLESALQARKDGSLDERGFYMQLLELNASLVRLLREELANQQKVMAEREVRKQIPLILVMLEEQIALFRARQG